MTKTKYLYISILLLWSCQGGSSRTNSNPPNTPVTKHTDTGGDDVISPHYHNNDPPPREKDDSIPDPDDSSSRCSEHAQRFFQVWTMKADKYIDKFLKGGFRPYSGEEFIRKYENNTWCDIDWTWNGYMRLLLSSKWDKYTERTLAVLSKYKNTPNGPDDDDYNMKGKYGYLFMKWFQEHPYTVLPNIEIREFAKKQRMVDCIFQFNPDLTPQNLQYAMNMGIDIYEVDEYGYNALYRAAYYGCYKVIPFLESQGLKWDVNLNPMAKKYGNDDCLIIWSYDKTATEVPRIENEEKYLEIIEWINIDRISERRHKALIDYMYETRFKCPRIFLRQGVGHSSDPDKIKCPDGMPLIEYCKKYNFTYGRSTFIKYLINECGIEDTSDSPP